MEIKRSLIVLLFSFVLIFSSFPFIPLVKGDDTGFQNPTANSGSWLYPTKAYTSNDDWAIPDPDAVHVFYDFHFNDTINVGDTVDGIIVSVEGFCEREEGQTMGVEISINGGSGYSSTGYTTNLGVETDNTDTAGGSTNTWGLGTLDGDDVDDTSFRVQCTAPSVEDTIDIDHVCVKIYYTPASDDTPPDITINFAGNLSDEGGPYWRPPGESDVLDEVGEGVWRDGYYTNASHQHEDWIYINCTVNDTESSVSNVWLNWLNETTWTNYTYAFSNTAGDYWEYNTSGNIQTCEGYNYSFNIVANNSFGASNHTFWNKTGLGGTYTRRYVQLNCTPSSIEYTPFYTYDIPYSIISGNENKDDRLRHDQGLEGTTHDLGFLKPVNLTDTVEYIWCNSYLAFWVEHDISAESFNLDNIYCHAWFNVIGTWLNVGYTNSRGHVTSDNPSNYYVFTNTVDNRSSIVYDTKTYKLTTHLLDVTNKDITDNNVYEILFKAVGTSQTPRLIANQSFQSFILLNVPSNETLNASAESDTDGLTDWQELFVTYTNPFVDDTDNDGVSDYYETLSGTDPNNYTDYILTSIPELTSSYGGPDNAIDSYTTIYFNITWADADGDDPTDGYLKVNISKTGWSTNQSMIWVTGSNTTGADYSYSCTLTAGEYSYTFYAYDGIYYNSSGPHSGLTVVSQSISISVSKSDTPSLWFNMTTPPYRTESNVNASGQTTETPALAIENQGNVPINLTIKVNSSFPLGRSMKWDDDNTPSGATTVTTSEVQIAENLAMSAIKNVWLWMNFDNVSPDPPSGETKERTVTITSSSGSW